MANIPEEALLALAVKNKGGGGGNYNNLSNKPQIGGVTLQGNKSLADFGIKNEFNGTIEEWDALTTEQKKAFDTYQITNDFTEGRYIYLPTIYSEEERQVGVWKDGKPLYQKTFHFVETTEQSVKDYDISSLNTENAFVVNSMFKFGAMGGGAWFSDVWWDTASYNMSVSVSIDSAKIHAICKGWNFTELIVTIQYTKTTDTAGSGIWTPSGEIAHHYSTDEQIVGTWIDGSTVWERTQNGGISISANDTWYDTVFTGVSKVVSFNCSLLRDVEEISSVFNDGHIDYVVRDNMVKIKGHGFLLTDNFTLDHLTIQYTKTT